MVPCNLFRVLLEQVTNVYSKIILKPKFVHFQIMILNIQLMLTIELTKKADVRWHRDTRLK